MQIHDLLVAVNPRAVWPGLLSLAIAVLLAGLVKTKLAQSNRYWLGAAVRSGIALEFRKARRVVTVDTKPQFPPRK
jgi:hypothetical protein